VLVGRGRPSESDVATLEDIHSHNNQSQVSALVSGDCCGSVKPLCNGVPPDLGGGGGGSFHHQRWKVAVSIGVHDGQGASFDFLSLRGLRAKLLGQLSLFPLSSYLHVYVYVFLI
jgi:hypothetical protein